MKAKFLTWLQKRDREPFHLTFSPLHFDIPMYISITH